MRIFVDLDGVLADFDAGAERVFGMAPREFEQLHGAKVFWKRLAEAPDFYATLDWMPDGRELWQGVLAHSPRPRILTGLPLGSWAEPQKRAWVHREIGPAFTVLCCRSIDKHKYCVAGDVLIDDRKKNGLDWRSAGGRFILHTDAASSLEQLAAIVAGTG